VSTAEAPQEPTQPSEVKHELGGLVGLAGLCASEHLKKALWEHLCPAAGGLEKHLKQAMPGPIWSL
jgi:hypothetical protein